MSWRAVFLTFIGTCLVAAGITAATLWSAVAWDDLDGWMAEAGNGAAYVTSPLPLRKDRLSREFSRFDSNASSPFSWAEAQGKALPGGRR